MLTRFVRTGLDALQLCGFSRGLRIDGEPPGFWKIDRPSSMRRAVGAGMAGTSSARPLSLADAELSGTLGLLLAGEPECSGQVTARLRIRSRAVAEHTDQIP